MGKIITLGRYRGFFTHLPCSRQSVTERGPENIQWSPDSAKLALIQRDDTGEDGDLMRPPINKMPIASAGRK
jgi:hypothetical protein